MQVNAKKHFLGFPKLRLSQNPHKLLNAKKINNEFQYVQESIYNSAYLPFKKFCFEFVVLDVVPER